MIFNSASKSLRRCAITRRRMDKGVNFLRDMEEVLDFSSKRSIFEGPCTTVRFSQSMTIFLKVRNGRPSIKSAHKLGTITALQVHDDQEELTVDNENSTKVERKTGFASEEPSNARVTGSGFTSVMIGFVYFVLFLSFLFFCRYTHDTRGLLVILTHMRTDH
jgi:hypothetical protein